VADVNGTVWATRAGALVNVDLETGRVREWTLADDPAFAAAVLAPRRWGGVWLVGPDAIRLFDGQRFRAVIDVPGYVWSVAEGSDGSLWAATDPYGLIRWADGTWTGGPAGRPGWGVAEVVVDGRDRVWTADYDQGASSGRGLSAWDGSRWTTYTPSDLLGQLGADLWPIASGDGSVWVESRRQVARFQAGTWSRYDVPGLQGSVSLSAVGDDGRLWFVREDCESCGVQIQVYDGSTLTMFDQADGLPGPADVSWPSATVLPGPGYVLASTEAGLYRLVDGSWERLETSTPPGPTLSPLPSLGGIAALAAMSSTEVWASVGGLGGTPQEGGLLRFDGAAWERQSLPVKSPVGQAAVGPDGALWVATSSGPLVRRDGSWIDLGDAVAGVVPEPGAGSGGCGGAVLIGRDGDVYYAGARSGNRLVRLAPVGSSWEASLFAAAPMGIECASTLAMTADGTIFDLKRVLL
jgi:hypothetical protein